VTNFLAHYDLTRRLQIALQVDNLFDHHTNTARSWRTRGLSAQGTFLSQPFPAYANGNYPVPERHVFHAWRSTQGLGGIAAEILITRSVLEAVEGFLLA